MISHPNSKNLPPTSDKITQLDLVGSSNIYGRRPYTSSKRIIEFAIGRFRKAGKGLTYIDLMISGIALRQQAQDILKYQLRQGNIFILKDRRPQQYYPTKIRSEVIEKIATRNNNTPIDPSAVALSKIPLCKGSLANCLESVIIQTLEGYVLPLLREAPLLIHNIQLKTNVHQKCYSELKLGYYKKNKGKYHEEIIGKTLVTYIFYKSGTVDIHTLCTNNPYKLEAEEDTSRRILVFFGQVRAGLISVLHDKYERIVPDTLEWELTECDINKDIKVSDVLHFTAIKIQVKHLDHLFRIYVKAMSKDTVCRVEENKHPKKLVIEFINDGFNPYERLERQILEQDKKLTEISGLLKKLAIHRFHIDSSLRGA
jgi:hypothetical protein